MDLTRLLLSFVIGGAICVVAQLLIDLTRLTPARILVIYVCFGVLLGGIGLYKPLFNIAGAGASVPLIGFGANVADGVMKAVDERGVIGVLEGPFTAASVGCSSALIFGYICSVFFKSKSKRT